MKARIRRKKWKAKKNTPKVDVHVEINGTDTMMYSKTSFEVKSGQKVKLTFNNTGKLPKAAMGHNVVILKKSVNLIEFCTDAIKFPTEGYFPKSREKDVIGRTKLLGPGEKDDIYTVTFTIKPPKKGEIGMHFDWRDEVSDALILSLIHI